MMTLDDDSVRMLIGRRVEYRAVWPDGTMRIVQGTLRSADRRGGDHATYERELDRPWWVLRFDQLGLINQEFGRHGRSVKESLTLV